jgi:uncharacterized integral membrane protein (TIGR00698 family)
MILKAFFILLALATLNPAVPAGGALVAGIVLSLTLGNPYSSHTKKLAARLLQLSVIGLGADLDLITVAKVGYQGLGYTAATITLTLLLGLLLGRALRVARTPSLLIASGTAICGGSAIAAVSAAIAAPAEDISVSMATVFVLNSVALLIFPPLGHALGLSQTQFGLWSALAVHDTSSVVGTTLQYGATALHVGTTVKLARALWIAPMTLVLGLLFSTQGKGGGIKFPWFIVGFVAMAAAVTWLPVIRPAGTQIAFASRRLLVLTLFLIGANLNAASLRAVGPRPLVQGLVLWLVVGTATAAAVVAGWIAITGI